MNSALLILVAFAMNAQSIRFNKNGECKIVQFTDVHYKVSNPDNSSLSLQVINETLDKEKPEVVILTGDIVTGTPVEQGWKEVLTPIVERNIPFAVTFGNHDDESGVSRKDLMKYIRTFKGCLNTEIGNETEYDGAIRVKGSDSDQTKAALYLFDSNSYSTLNGVNGYGWIKPKQIEAYNQLSNSFTKENGGNPLPALAFFHIPLPEYVQAFNSKKASPVGERLEDECPAAMNTGLYASMKINGDVMGTFCGHDHNNDYLADMDGIAMVYGRFTGSKNTYTDTENGARIITLKEGLRSFDTKVRLRSGKEICAVTYPSVKLNTMSFNMRYDNQGDGANKWDNRKYDVVNTIRDYQVDLLGTQELLNHQVDFLKHELKGYNQVGVGRIDGKTQGEYSAIFYKNDRFTELNSGNFWLSKNPEAVGVKGWDAACERIATWALLKDNRTGKEIFFINTHFDHVGKKAQKESAKLLKRKIKELKGNADCVLVTGDFNITPANPAIAELQKPEKDIHLIDSRAVAEKVDGPAWSFHDFGKLDYNKRSLIDYVFVSEGAKVASQHVIFNPEASKCVSDHAPVLSVVEF
ncbi:MAG: endonuclease/exonuclease/phosphatase family protein [Bacteroidales bacterium]